MSAQQLSPDAIAELTRLEQAMWQAETRFAPAFAARYFASDFVEIGRPGWVYDRAEVLAQSAQRMACQLPLPNLAVRAIDSAAALLTYDRIVNSSRDLEYARRSSLWPRGPQGWAPRFHQGTPYASSETNHGV